MCAVVYAIATRVSLIWAWAPFCSSTNVSTIVHPRHRGLPAAPAAAATPQNPVPCTAASTAAAARADLVPFRARAPITTWSNHHQCFHHHHHHHHFHHYPYYHYPLLYCTLYSVYSSFSMLHTLYWSLCAVMLPKNRSFFYFCYNVLCSGRLYLYLYIQAVYSTQSVHVYRVTRSFLLSGCIIRWPIYCADSTSSLSNNIMRLPSSSQSPSSVYSLYIISFFKINLLSSVSQNAHAGAFYILSPFYTTHRYKPEGFHIINSQVKLLCYIIWKFIVIFHISINIFLSKE